MVVEQTFGYLIEIDRCEGLIDGPERTRLRVEFDRCEGLIEGLE